MTTLTATTAAPITPAKQLKKVYTSGYWTAARGLAAHTFGAGSKVAARYAQGYNAGLAAYAAGRAQRTMVWSTQRAGMPLVKVTRTLVAPAELALSCGHGAEYLSASGRCNWEEERGSWGIATCNGGTEAFQLERQITMEAHAAS